MSFRPFFLLALIASLSSGAIFGATAVPSASLEQPVAPVLTSQQFKDSLATSQALFAQGDTAGGEAALFSVNRHPDGTPLGNRDSGIALLRVACVFLQEGDGATASRLAKLALGKFTQAKLALANSPWSSADIQTRIGFIQEKLLGDREAAKASYRAAVQFSPQAAMANAELTRLEAEDAINARREAK